MVRIVMEGDTTFEESDLDLSLLEMSLKNGVSHMHACGGNARCSTCRVIILRGCENLLPRNEAEQRLAEKKGLEPNIRLACQSRIKGPVRLRRLVRDSEDADLALAHPGTTTGREMNLAILFSDIRDFTPFSTSHLPYDIVHILNRYFRDMGEAILHYQGRIDKYIGDGIMALFGLAGSDDRASCWNAVQAGLEMLENLKPLNVYLKEHFAAEFRIGIGIHFGTVLVGDMGHPLFMQFTAMGDAVNMASRIESATKEAGAPLLISEAVWEKIGSHVQLGKVVESHLKGKEGSFILYHVEGLKEDLEHPALAEDPAEVLERELKRVISRHNAPIFLRLAFRDATAYNRAAGEGGPNGSVHLPEELERPENRGLDVPIRMLEMAKETLPPVSWGDLIALAGAVAVAQTNGPHIRIPLGRKDSDVPSPRCAPFSTMSIAELKASFGELGLSPQDLVALSGAHTVGRAMGRPLTDDLFTFSNSYFRVLLSEDDTARSQLLPSDLALLEDSECREHIVRYAMDQEIFFKEFAEAYRKMTLLGTDLEPTVCVTVGREER